MEMIAKDFMRRNLQNFDFQNATNRQIVSRIFSAIALKMRLTTLHNIQSKILE